MKENEASFGNILYVEGYVSKLIKVLGKDLRNLLYYNHIRDDVSWRGLMMSWPPNNAVSLASQPVLSCSSFLRENLLLQSGSDILKFMWQFFWVRSLSQLLPKCEQPFDSGFITFFSNSRTSESNSFTHYNFPNVKRLCEYKVLRKIKK